MTYQSQASNRNYNKNVFNNKILGPDDFIGKFYQKFREELTSILIKIFQKISEEEKSPKSLARQQSSRLLNPEMPHTKKEIAGHFLIAAAAAKPLHLCLMLCDPTEGSPPGSPIPGILQARTLEWDAISFSSAWKWKAKVKSLSFVRLFRTPWTSAYQAPPSMGFSRQEYWSGVPCLLWFPYWHWGKNPQKILKNRIWKHIKRIIDHDQLGFIPGRQWLCNMHRSNNAIYHINKLKDKNHICAGKVFYKLQHPPLTNTLQKVGREETYHYIPLYNKIHDKPRQNIILSAGILKIFPLISGTRQWWSHLQLRGLTSRKVRGAQRAEGNKLQMADIFPPSLGKIKRGFNFVLLTPGSAWT